MENIFLDLFNMSINACWLVLAIILFRLIFKKAPKSLRVIMWGLVGLRLICPFSFESVLSLIPSAEPVPPEIIHSNSSANLSGVDILNSVGNNQVNYDLGIQSGSIVFNEYTAPDGNTINPLLIITYIASIIWIVGMVAMLLYTLISYLRIVRKVREATPLQENIWICDNISTPFILGIIKPRIFLPSSMNEQDLEFVIAHEKAHLKRRDHLWKPLGFALLTVYWFNPVLWVAYVLLCRDIELACDEKVIKELGTEIKKPYSEALINCSVPRKMISACPLAFGETGVKGRIKSVLNYKKPAFWVIVVAVVTCVVLAVCFMTNPETSNDDNSSQQENNIQNNYGITNITNGSEYDGVSINFETASFSGESRYIELLWENQTDKPVSFGEPCYIYKKVGSEWIECELPENYAWNLLAYLLNADSTTTHEYGLYGYEEFTTGEYHFETYFSFEENHQKNYKVWIEFELVGITAQSDTYEPIELVYDNGMFSFVQTIDIAPTYYVTNNMKLTEVFPNGLLYERGTLEEISLNEENWDSRFSLEMWSEGYSCSQIKENNKKAWQLKVDNGKDDISILYLLLEQKDGTYFIAHGMYNNQSENPRNKDDSLIRWLYLVAKNPTESSVGSADAPDGTLQYFYNRGKDQAYLSLNPETKSFSFTFSLFSSYQARGTYEEIYDCLELETDDRNEYLFLKEGENLIFIAAKSSPMPQFKYSEGATEEVCVPDGAVFELQESADNTDKTVFNEALIQLISEVGDIDAIHYPTEEEGKNALILIGRANGAEIAKHLKTVDWKECKAPSESLSSLGSAELIIDDNYRITVYKKKNVFSHAYAVITYNGAKTYYRADADDYENIVDLLKPPYSASVSWANYSDGAFIGGLNADKFHISHTKHIPIFKFDSVDDLNNFKSLYGEVLTMDKGMDEIPSFNSVTANYDDTFFEDNSLLLVYVESGSMSWRYGVESISVNNTSLLVKVERTDNNETGDSAMSGWFITIAMDKEELENYTEFDAIMLEE